MPKTIFEALSWFDGEKAGHLSTRKRVEQQCRQTRHLRANWGQEKYLRQFSLQTPDQWFDWSVSLLPGLFGRPPYFNTPISHIV